MGAKPSFLRFLVVGGLNTLFGYGCFAALLYVGLHYSIALLAATVLGILFNFQTTGRLVFGSSNPGLIGRFLGVYLLTYMVNLAGIKALSAVGLNAYYGGAILLLPTAFLAFYLNKRYVFHHD